MPLPLILFGAAAAGGIGSAIRGKKKIKDANDTIKAAQARHEQNIARYNEQNEMTTVELKKLGMYELDVVRQFQPFSDMFEKIQNKPQFGQIQTDGVELPHVDLEDLRVAAGNTNLGLNILTAGTLILAGSVWSLAGGVAMHAMANKQQKKANEAWDQMMEAEASIDKICGYLVDLRMTTQRYMQSITKANELYVTHLKEMSRIINIEKRLDWKTYTGEERLLIKNTATLTELLFHMCKVQLVLKTDDPNGIPKINTGEIVKMQEKSERMRNQIGVAAAVVQ